MDWSLSKKDHMGLNKVLDGVVWDVCCNCCHLSSVAAAYHFNSPKA